MKDYYHSALSNNRHMRVDESQIRPLPSHRFHNGIAFAWDLADDEQDMKVLYRNCDVLYMDPPWRSGYEPFMRKADAEIRVSHEDLLKRIYRLVLDLDVPAVITNSRQAKTCFPGFTAHRTRLNGDDVTAYFYKEDEIEDLDITDSVSIIRSLLKQYRTIGDPFCGYGRTAELATIAGCDFVCSDVNQRCIGLMAERL